jgi:anaerobic selenocysteine-containing dehydrogenase
MPMVTGQVATHCPYCSLQCGITLRSDESGVVVAPQPDFPTNRGGLIVVDPRRTATAAIADLHLQPVPGTDLAIANGMLHIAVRGVFWPCPSPRHPGTPRLFTVDFPTPDRRARIHAVEHRGGAEVPDADYPYYLTTGRLAGHYQSGTQTRRVGALVDAEPVAAAQMHDSLAQRIGVRDGDLVRLRTRRGEAVMTARVTADVRADTVFAPFHWAGRHRRTV